LKLRAKETSWEDIILPLSEGNTEQDASDDREGLTSSIEEKREVSTQYDHHIVYKHLRIQGGGHTPPALKTVNRYL